MESQVNNKSKKELYIPVPIPDSDDYISGIGQMEVGIIAATLFVAIGIGIILSVMRNTIVGVSVGAFVIFTVISVIRRDAYNENLIKKIRIFVRYKKAQKRFIYVFKNDFWISSEEEEDEE